MKLTIKSTGSDGFSQTNVYNILFFKEYSNEMLGIEYIYEINQTYKQHFIYEDGLKKKEFIFTGNKIIIQDIELGNADNFEIVNSNIDQVFSVKERTKRNIEIGEYALELDIITNSINANKIFDNYEIDLEYDIFQGKEKINNMKIFIKIEK